MNKLNTVLLSLTLLLEPQQSPRIKNPELSETAQQTHENVVSVTAQSAPPAKWQKNVENTESEEVRQALRVLERNHHTNSPEGFENFAKQILPQLQRKLPFELQRNSDSEGEVSLVLEKDGYRYIFSRPNEGEINYKFAYNLKFEELHEEDGVWVTTDENLFRGNMVNLLAEKILAEFIASKPLRVNNSAEIGG